MADKLYHVTIPNGISPGDNFTVMIEGSVVRLKCPPNAYAGCVLDVKVLPPTMATIPHEPNNQQDNPFPFCWMWIISDVILFILLTLAYTLNPYAVQQISHDCGVINAKSQLPLTDIYYFLYDGISSNPDTCTNNGQNFCVPWSRYAFWNSFDTIANGIRGVYGSGDSSYDWRASQTLIPLASGFMIVAAIILIVAVAIRPKINLEVYLGTASGTLILIVIGFCLATSALSLIVNSNSMSATSWAALYKSISTGGSNYGLPVTVAANTSSCTIGLFYTTGGSLLASAVTISFIVWILLIGLICCAAIPASSRYDRPSYTDVVIIEQAHNSATK